MSLFSNSGYGGLTHSPSVLAAFKNNKIVRIKRAYNKMMLDRLLGDCRGVVNDRDIFNLIPGTLLFYMENGDVIGVDAEDQKSSIVVWMEAVQGVETDEYYFLKDACEYIEHDDSRYSHEKNWKQIVDKTIVSLEVVRYQFDRDKMDFEDSCQRGLVIRTSGGELIIAYQLAEFKILSTLALCSKTDIPNSVWKNSTTFEV